MNIIPADVKLIGGAIAAIALAGAVWYVVANERAIGAQGVQLAVAQQHAQDVAAASARNEQIHTDQEASDHEADKFKVQAALAAPRARSAADGLQQRFAAINASCVPDRPTVAAGSPPASSASDLRADVLRRVAEAALAVASAADGSRGAGERASGRYDALTKSAAASAP